MRKLSLIGIGAGNPEHITVQAIRALNAVDVFFIMDKGDTKQTLLHIRREICERYIEGKNYRIVQVEDAFRDPDVADYAARVELWHEQRSMTYERIILDELKEDQVGAFLVWGDPSLYDSTLRILDRVLARGALQFDIEMIPGITSMQALAAQHHIALNGIGESVLITTGRKLSSTAMRNMDAAIVMLDGKCAFQQLRDQDWEIFWGAYIGMDQEILLSGKLSDMADEIESVRSEARRKNHWIMDTYLLRRS